MADNDVIRENGRTVLRRRPARKGFGSFWNRWRSLSCSALLTAMPSADRKTFSRSA